MSFWKFAYNLADISFNVKSAESTSIFLSTARIKKPLKKHYLRIHVGVKWKNLIGSLALRIRKTLAT